MEKQTADQKFMEMLQQSFEEMQREEYAKKVEVLERKLNSTRAALEVAQVRLTQATQELTPQEVADGKLDAYIRNVRMHLVKMDKLETQIETVKELVGGADNETEK